MKSLIVAVLVTSFLWLAQNAAALEIALIDAANAGGSLHQYTSRGGEPPKSGVNY